MKPLTGRWKLGVALTILSILFWGCQPIAIAMIKTIPYPTLAFYKLFSATVLISAFLFLRGRFPAILSLGRRPAMLLIIAAASLAISYVAFNSSFHYISPSNVQVYFQLSRIFMALAGIFLFKESFNRLQWAGLVAVCAGLALFFHFQLSQTREGDLYFFGVALAIASAATWAIYAIFQKSLLAQMSSLQILTVIYILSTLFLIPYAEVAPLGQLAAPEWIALGFVCLSNVLAFAFFSESLNHWESAKIGTVSCLTPLVTISMMSLAAGTAIPSLRPENLDLTSLLGAALSIAGSVLVVAFV